jgi:membrane protease YdiL (CAAX protease family)
MNILKFMTTRITIGLLILLTHLFLLTNASWLFGDYATQAVFTLTVYMLFTVFALAAYTTGMPMMTEKAYGFYIMIGAFLGTTVVSYYFIVPFLSASGTVATVIASLESVKAALAMGMLFAFVKAFDEEVVFRHILQNVAGLGVYIQSVLFGLFHTSMLFSSVYLSTGVAGVFVSMALLTTLGLLWGFMAKRWGLMASLGSHFGWNLVVLGLGASIVGV